MLYQSTSHTPYSSFILPPMFPFLLHYTTTTSTLSRMKPTTGYSLTNTSNVDTVGSIYGQSVPNICSAISGIKPNVQNTSMYVVIVQH